MGNSLTLDSTEETVPDVHPIIQAIIDFVNQPSHAASTKKQYTSKLRLFQRGFESMDDLFSDPEKFIELSKYGVSYFGNKKELQKTTQTQNLSILISAITNSHSTDEQSRNLLRRIEDRRNTLIAEIEEDNRKKIGIAKRGVADVTDIDRLIENWSGYSSLTNPQRRLLVVMLMYRFGQARGSPTVGFGFRRGMLLGSDIVEKIDYEANVNQMEPTREGVIIFSPVHKTSKIHGPVFVTVDHPIVARYFAELPATADKFGSYNSLQSIMAKAIPGKKITFNGLRAMIVQQEVPPDFAVLSMSLQKELAGASLTPDSVAPILDSAVEDGIIDRRVANKYISELARQIELSSIRGHSLRTALSHYSRAVIPEGEGPA